MKKPVVAVAGSIGFLIIFIFVYLIAAQNQVAAPTKSQEQSKITSPSPEGDLNGNEDAFKNALNLYIQKKKDGVDMSKGPCLGKVAEDWVLDIAHDPRNADDDKKENQCQEYLNGQAKHFIELDPEGKLIKFN